MQPQNQNQKIFDVVIVGGGIAGVLAATRLMLTHPNLSIALFEQSSQLGGRLKSSLPKERLWANGLGGMTPQLVTFLTNTLQAFPDSLPLETWLSPPRKTLGVLSGNELSTCSYADLMGQPLVSKIGGSPAVREWPKLLALLEKQEPSERESPIQKHWKGEMKNPALLVCQHLARLMGIPDLSAATLQSLQQRSEYMSACTQYGDMNGLLAHLIQLGQQVGTIHTETQCRVIESWRRETTWELQTEKGLFSAQKLIVAVNPWQALPWLEHRQIPVHILNLAFKAKPVSVVTLSEQLIAPCSLPDVILIPSEQVEVFHSRGRDLCFQTTVDYELSFDAPSVEKAIRRIRRAHKKLHLLLGESITQGEHLALTPIAWPNNPHHSDFKLFQKLGAEVFQSPHLSFVGDAYGSSYNPESNLLESLLSCYDPVTS